MSLPLSKAKSYALFVYVGSLLCKHNLAMGSKHVECTGHIRLLSRYKMFRQHAVQPCTAFWLHFS